MIGDLTEISSLGVAEVDRLFTNAKILKSSRSHQVLQEAYENSVNTGRKEVVIGYMQYERCGKATTGAYTIIEQRSKKVLVNTVVQLYSC